MQYEEKILQALLDSYERSSLSRGENVVTVHISFPINKKTMPVYFDENSSAYESIHGAVAHMEELGYAYAAWKGGRKNHILEKVILCEKNVDEIYSYLGRTPKKSQQQMQLEVLEELKQECQTPAASSFLFWLIERLNDGKTVKEYLNLADAEETRKLLRAVTAIESNKKEIYLREFSVRCFGDSKELQKKLGLIGKILRRFSDSAESFSEMDTEAILAEYQIYHTPNYVYLKGTGSLKVGKPDGCIMHLSNLKQGIGLSGEDLDSLEWMPDMQVQKVLTIENLTTFFSWKEPDCVMIYLGGYHNTVRRTLLSKLYRTFPQAQYLHFGDIDVGGFEIYRDLCEKTGIPFQPYRMGTEELEQYAAYTKKLTANDKKRLDTLLEKEVYEPVWPVLEYMKVHGVKLEQESILCSPNEMGIIE